MFKNILILFCVYFSLSCSFLNKSNESRKPSANDKPKHYVFLIHGLAGTVSPRDKISQETSYSGTFGFMKSAMKEDIERMNSGHREVIVAEAEYGTGNDKKSPYDFALEFGKIVKDQIKKKSHINGSLTSQDMISIVVHSQGGLVATIWYTYSRVADEQSRFMKENPNLSEDDLIKVGYLSLERHKAWIEFKDIYPRVNNLITLGSPFWGAKTAYAGFLVNNKKLRATIKDKVGFWEEAIAFLGDNLWGLFSGTSLIEMGKKELEEMSFGSNSIYKFRRRAIWTHKNLGGLPINTINIGGVALKSSDIKKSPSFQFSKSSKKNLKLMEGTNQNDYSGGGFGGDYFESDLAVLLPSSRFDFIYADFAGKKNVSKVEFDDFTHTHFKAKGRNLIFSPRHAIHASPDIESVYDIVAAPYKCKPEFRDMIDMLSLEKSKYLRKKFVNARLIDPNFLDGEELSQSHFQTFEVVNGGNDKFSKDWYYKLSIKLAGKWHSDLTDEEISFAKMLYYYQDEEIKLNKENLTCDHPVYHDVIGNLVDCKLTDCNQNEINKFYSSGYNQAYDKYQKTRGAKTLLYKQMRGFFVDLNLQLPDGYDVKQLGSEFDMQETLFKKILKFPVENSILRKTGELVYRPGPAVDDRVRLFVNRKRELLNYRSVVQKINYKGKDEYHLRIYFTGVVYPKPGREKYTEKFLEKAKDGFPMKFKVQLPKLKPLEIEAKVSPMYSTFIDVEMEKS